MTGVATGKISRVSDTARWVAMYRAMESERPDALFRDPYARKLAGPEGPAILEALPKARKQFAWPMIVRTAVLDEFILEAVHRDGADTVLNLAAGLDARPYRLSLPASLTWIEVDLPPMLAYKREQLVNEQPRCRVDQAPVDLTDAAARRGLFARVGAEGRKVLIITEGLLVYLSREQVAELARDLAAVPSLRWWVLDIVGPEILKRLQKMWGTQLEAAPLQFGPAEMTAFFEPFGWRERAFRSTFMESLRLKRSVRFATFWALMIRLSPAKRREKMSRMAGFALLERAPTK